MISFPRPAPLYNPITVPPDQALTPWEVLASPFGLILFVALVPLVRLGARRWPRASLMVSGIVWVTATAGLLATPILLAGCLLGSAWVVLLGRLLRQGHLGRHLMLTLVWLGLAAMIAPLWWYPQWNWYGWHGGSRLAVLHNAGVAYFLLRFISWGVHLSRHPDDALRPLDSLSWILYAPCMRLGPVLLRHEYLERFDAWNPRAPVPWRQVAQRLGFFLLGGFLLAVITKNLPTVPSTAPHLDFFSSPEHYSTSRLLRVFYFVPIQAYLLLWMYNELACGLALWVGIRVDDNFDWLPKATSVRDFWRRWHVTVGNWLRHYIYLPLGTSRRMTLVRHCAVFGFCAVWHGASWSFVAWGASQVLALSVQHWWDQLRKRLRWRNRPTGKWWTVLCWLLTMHYQIATILMFMDFKHCGARVFHELWLRFASFVSS